MGLFTPARLDTDLAIAGLGLGLVIGPLTSATLRVVPSAQHGIASAAVVVARMIGMLVGIAALSAWGLYRFNQHLQRLNAQVGGDTPLERIAAQAANYRQAYVMQYGEIFLITVGVCVVGALLGLLISGRHEHAEEPEAAAARARRGRHAHSDDRRVDPGVRNGHRRRDRHNTGPRGRRQQRSTPRWSSSRLDGNPGVICTANAA